MSSRKRRKLRRVSKVEKRGPRVVESGPIRLVTRLDQKG